jgi:hypothetical protein
VKGVIASLVTALVLVAAGWAGGVDGRRTNALTPTCPQAHYGVDGTMGPVFCVVYNPVALHYYAPMGKHLFALGPNASPDQVFTATRADYANSTEPILCEVYRLAAWRNHWHFPNSVIPEVSTALHLPRSWCTEPTFKRLDY